MHQFACPHCGARLRVKDKSFAGRTVRCPDCRRPVLIQVAADGELTGVPQDAAAPAAAQPANQSSTDKSGLSPTLLAWGVALGVFAALLIFVFHGGQEQPAAQSPEVQSADNDLRPEQPTEPATLTDTAESRLAIVGRQIAAFRDNHGMFPATGVQPGVPDDQRFSWIAMLVAAEGQGGARPDLDRPWNDPANDRFVRQRIEQFQNPKIATLTGPGGHPVTHFAGMAGVGADAPGLPALHPRAGIFGSQRLTRIEDVKDGLGSTMLVAGVQDQLDSWARNGVATVRPLTAEPYVSGPDGFGTGEQGGMTVLMADGSVRFLGSDTDPRLMRRMAAMADGLPLDVATPGEPGEASPEPPPVAVEPPPAQAPEGPAGDPIVVPLAADEPLFDMDAALDQPIADFNQSTPRPVGEILKLVAELGGVAVDTTRLDKAAAERLDEVTTIALSDTTVRGVLDATVHAAGLDYTVGDGIVVLTAGESPPLP